MSVKVEIKQTKNKITIEDISILKNLKYGKLNENNCLILNKFDRYTIFYNPNRIGRGFEIILENDSIFMYLPIPTTISDIELFYSLIEAICKKIKTKEFYLNDELSLIGYANHFIEEYKEISLECILDIENQIRQKTHEELIIFGALNPISIGDVELEEINSSLEGFESLLDRLQQIDIYYANPILYQRPDKTVFAIYYIGEGIDTVVPNKPNLLYKIPDKLTNWYVKLSDNINIPYEDFINYISKEKYYDANHFIVTLDFNDIEYLSEEYSIDISTNEKKENTYWGLVIDNGYNHSNKIKKLSLNLDELSGFNHLAVYLKWCFEHKLLSNKLLKYLPSLEEDIKNNKDLRILIRDEKVFNGALCLGHLNEIGQDFTRKYYIFNKNNTNYYPACVDDYAINYFGEDKYNSNELKNEAYLFIPYDDNYYKELSKYIDTNWNNFKN